MRCAHCQHFNPPRSRYCNQCGYQLVSDREIRPKPPKREADRSKFAIPGTALGRSVPFDQVLFPTMAAANAALQGVGALVQPALETRMTVPGLGEIVRCFGVLGNNFATDEATDAGLSMDILAFDAGDQGRIAQAAAGITNRSKRALRGIDNERVFEKLQSGRIKYLPVNRLLSKRVEQDIAPVGLHLPWSIGGMDVPFGRRCRDALKGFGFVCYFGHLGRIEELLGEPAFKQTRLISVPFGVDGYHTWEAAISDDVVDEDCALLIEANALPVP